MKIIQVSIMFKIFAFMFLSVLFNFNAYSQTAVVANITNFRNNQGNCILCLFNNASSFKGETGSPFRCLTAQVVGKTAQTTFDNVPAGTYALFAFHDENLNQKMDKNFLGIPKEGYGASKNKLPFASAPSYEDNKFVVPPQGAITLQMKIRNIY